MFDPTIFDNLKVVFEGAMYDMDMNGSLQIVHRTDRVELSTMSRAFGMAAVLRPTGSVKGSFMLQASLADLSAELLSETGKQPGCSLELTFEFRIEEMMRDCAAAELALRNIWGEGPVISQTVLMPYGEQSNALTSRLVVQFARKLDERQIDDIPSLIDHLTLSLERLEALQR